MMDKVTVLLTGIGGGGHGEQILKALRLGAVRYRIIGTDASGNCANREQVDEYHRLPHATDPNYLTALVDLARKTGTRVILHGSEPEMIVLSHAGETLRKAGFYVPVNPPSVMAICQDKVRTFEHLARQGFRVPQYREIRHVNDIEGFVALPAIIKPSVGGGGSANVYIAQTRQELELFCSYLLTLFDRLMIQEYIGTPEAEFTVGVLFSADGVLLNSIGMRRIINNALSVRARVPNRTGRKDLGGSLVISSGVSQGVIGRWPEITAQCEEIAKSMTPTAPINIQCRIVDGVVLPFEINPRFSGTTSLRAMAGYNEPDVLIRRDVLGQQISTHFPYREMTIMRSLHENIIETE